MANLVSTLLLLSTTLTLACSSSQSGDDGPAPDAPAATPDGAPAPDAPAATPDGAPASPDALVGTAAEVVPCEGATTVSDVWFYDGLGYVGSALGSEHPVGSIVQFHDMSTHTADHVQGLFSVSGADPTCVRFDAPGTYDFHCYFHSQEGDTIKITN